VIALLVFVVIFAAFGAGMMVGLSCTPAPIDPSPRPDPARPLRPPTRPDFKAMWREMQPALDAIDASRRN
jgi:hypothetical protein